MFRDFYSTLISVTLKCVGIVSFGNFTLVFKDVPSVEVPRYFVLYNLWFIYMISISLTTIDQNS